MKNLKYVAGKIRKEECLEGRGTNWDKTMMILGDEGALVKCCCAVMKTLGLHKFTLAFLLLAKVRLCALERKSLIL